VARRYVGRVVEDAPLCLLLLPGVLEEVAFARRAQDLLRAPRVVAVEPGRRPAGLLADGVARRLARKLPGEPRVIVAFREREYPLARALLARHPGSELWYGAEDAVPRARAALVFDAEDRADDAAFRVNDELWSRLEELGIASR
jgi:hypothetical protein